MKKALVALVRNRAGGRCEYCGTLEATSPLKFHIEHAIPRQHRGGSSSKNLALACGFCNRHKGPNLSGIDPQTGDVVALFNPRLQRWSVHFRLRGAKIVGLTGCGRASVLTLAMNHPVQLAVRKWQIQEGFFAPL
jgi:hypothetical protein